MARRFEPRALTRADEEHLLGNWLLLNSDILELPELAVRQLLRRAIAEKRRKQVVLRLYARFSRLRMLRERDALITRGAMPCG